MNLAIFYIKKKSLSLHFWRMKTCKLTPIFRLNFFGSFWRYIVSENTKADVGGEAGGGVGWLHFFSILTTASRYQIHRLLGSHFSPSKLFISFFQLFSIHLLFSILCRTSVYERTILALQQ
jgi:hypothetical protein